MVFFIKKNSKLNPLTHLKENFFLKTNLKSIQNTQNPKTISNQGFLRQFFRRSLQDLILRETAMRDLESDSQEERKIEDENANERSLRVE